MDHNGLILLRYGIKGLLNDVTAKGVHAETQSVPTNGVCNGDDLFWSPMLEATLHEEVSEAVDHQRISLGDNRFNDFVLLLHCTNFELLLQEDRGLLVIVANNLVDDVLPVASHAPVEEATIIERLHR